jgi:hypothetical protein
MDFAQLKAFSRDVSEDRNFTPASCPKTKRQQQVFTSSRIFFI